MRLSLYWSFFKSIRFYYSYSICPNLSIKTAVNSICLGTCSAFFSLFDCLSKRVQKQLFFFNWQEIFEVFFEKFIFRFLLFFSSACQGTLHVLRGAKVSHVFKSHKLFLIFFENKFSTLIHLTCQCFKERTRCCGCKSSAFIRFDHDFF